MQCKGLSNDHYDCPVNMNHTKDIKMNVLIQNPSNLNISTSYVSVPSANYKVQQFNLYSHKYTNVISHEL